MLFLISTSSLLDNTSVAKPITVDPSLQLNYIAQRRFPLSPGNYSTGSNCNCGGNGGFVSFLNDSGNNGYGW